MANIRNLGEFARLTIITNAAAANSGAGTIINGAAGGTVNGAPLGEFEYHSVIYAGSFANNGTLNVYVTTNAGGSNPAIVRSLPTGSNNNQWIAVDVKSSAVGSISSALGTPYTHVSAMATVESGGTWRGAMFILSYNSRNQPPGTTNLGSYGTYLV